MSVSPTRLLAPAGAAAWPTALKRQTADRHPDSPECEPTGAIIFASLRSPRRLDRLPQAVPPSEITRQQLGRITQPDQPQYRDGRLTAHQQEQEYVESQKNAEQG